MTDARGRGIGHFVFACCCTWRKPDSVKRQTAVDGRSDRGDASSRDRTLRMNTGWPSLPIPPASSRQFDVLSFTRGTSRRACCARTSHQYIRCRQGDEDVGNHHPIGIAIQKLDERRAYLVFLHRNSPRAGRCGGFVRELPSR
jgi:hypothetical protein